MTTDFDPKTAAVPSDPRLLLETDREELVSYLRRDPMENVYLLARIAVDGVVNEESTAHGRFYGHFQGSELDGIVFFGHRKGVVLAGNSPDFLKGAAGLALGAEADWIILVGPRAPTDGFLSHYRWRGRPTHINRIQDFYVLRETSLTLEASGIRRAELADLEDVVEMSEQMLLEDFGLERGSLSRDGIRESSRLKILDGRTWVLEDRGETVFKVDISAQYSGGAMIEGVFTRPHRRGRGFAKRGVSGVCAHLLRESNFVSLHVDRNNSSARRAYEKAGFRPHSEFRLVLLEVAPSR